MISQIYQSLIVADSWYWMEIWQVLNAAYGIWKGILYKPAYASVAPVEYNSEAVEVINCSKLAGSAEIDQNTYNLLSTQQKFPLDIIAWYYTR